MVDLDLQRIINGNLNINAGVENFGALLYNNVNRLFGKKNGQSCSSRKCKSPWFNNAELKRANKEFRKHKSQVLYEVLLQKRKYYSKIKRRAQAVYKNERQRLHDLASSSPKSFWQETRQLKENKSKLCNVSLQAFYEHFSQIYSENNGFSLNHVEEYIENNLSNSAQSGTGNEQNVNKETLDFPVSHEELLQAITKLKRNKCPGLDRLSCSLTQLMYCATQHVNYLTFFFQQQLSS